MRQKLPEYGEDSSPDGLLHLAHHIQGECELIVGPQVAVDEDIGANCHSKGRDAGVLCVSIEACDGARNVQQGML